MKRTQKIDFLFFPLITLPGNIYNSQVSTCTCSIVNEMLLLISTNSGIWMASEFQMETGNAGKMEQCVHNSQENSSVKNLTSQVSFCKKLLKLS